MPTKQSTADYLLDQLQPLKNVRVRKMFGEYAFYCDEKVVALVCDNELFVKITEPGKKLLGKNYREGFPYPGAKPWMQVSGDLCEDSKFLCSLVAKTSEILPKPKEKSSQSKRKGVK